MFYAAETERLCRNLTLYNKNKDNSIRPTVPLNINKNNNLDNPSNDELPAFLTAGREQYMKIMLAIFPPLELIEHSLGERPKTLCTDEASGMKQFSVRIYNLCFRFEPVIAACTRDGIHVGCTVHFTSQGCHGVGPL